VDTVKDKFQPKTESRVDVKFKNFKVHSENLNDYFDSDEPTNRVKAESDGTKNKADVSFEQMVKGETFPNYKNAGLRKNVDRRYK
jgi:hypothetical protein